MVNGAVFQFLSVQSVYNPYSQSDKLLGGSFLQRSKQEFKKALPNCCSFVHLVLSKCV